MSQAERKLLRDLRDAGPGGVSRSRVPSSCGPIVQELLTCGAACWKAAGRGRVLHVVHPEAFQRLAARRFPLGLEDSPEEIVDRASAVRVMGDAKAAARGACEGVFVRSTRPGTVVRSIDGSVTIPVAELTEAAGGAALLLDDQRQWRFSGTVAVIENAEAFWRHDRVLDVDLAVYAGGCMSSRRMLAWLASDAMGQCQVIHWGDYDPVGAEEYLRLVAACPGRVRMHVPDELESWLARYGKSELLSDQIDALDRLRRQSGDPLIARLVEIWDRHQRALEQELLLALS